MNIVAQHRSRVFIEGGYDQVQQAIKAMGNRVPEAAKELEWLSWLLVGQTSAIDLQEVG